MKVVISFQQQSEKRNNEINRKIYEAATLF